jgi:hypothetical protein
VVLAVVPVTALVLEPVLLAVRSTDDGDNKPLYSATTAAEVSADAKVMVIPLVPLETPGPYQISVVVPPLFAACETLVQETPPPVILETLLEVVPLVEIRAIRVFPATGFLGSVTGIALELIDVPVAL